LTFTKLSTTNK